MEAADSADVRLVKAFAHELPSLAPLALASTYRRLRQVDLDHDAGGSQRPKVGETLHRIHHRRKEIILASVQSQRIHPGKVGQAHPDHDAWGGERAKISIPACRIDQRQRSG